MKYYIFDREKDDVLRDDDGQSIYWQSQDDGYNYLSKECQFTDKWINDNFFIVRGQKILAVEDIPEIKEHLVGWHKVSFLGKLMCFIGLHKWKQGYTGNVLSPIAEQCQRCKVIRQFF